MEQKTKGNYFGTEIDRKWWKRYKSDGLFARGNGEFWMDEEGIHFHKMLTKNPFVIFWTEIKSSDLGKWHAGQWAAGRPILKIDFERNSLKLCAGFLISKDWNQMEILSRDLNARLQKRTNR